MGLSGLTLLVVVGVLEAVANGWWWRWEGSSHPRPVRWEGRSATRRPDAASANASPGGGRRRWEGPFGNRGNFLHLNTTLRLLPVVQRSAVIHFSNDVCEERSCQPVRVDWFLPRDGGLSLGGGGRGPVRGGPWLAK